MAESTPLQVRRRLLELPDPVLEGLGTLLAMIDANPSLGSVAGRVLAGLSEAQPEGSPERTWMAAIAVMLITAAEAAQPNGAPHG